MIREVKRYKIIIIDQLTESADFACVMVHDYICLGDFVGHTQDILIM